MSAEGLRRLRVAETLKMHLVELISRELGDPRLRSVVVTRVELPDDLSVAFVSVRALGRSEQGGASSSELAASEPVHGAEPDGERRAAPAVRALERASPRLRHLLAPRLGLRRVPDLRFRYDAGQDAAERVDAILADIAAEERRRGTH